MGRVYLLLGGTASGTASLDSAAAYIWEHFAIGGGVFAVGDTNLDGYSEFAFGRSVESNTGEQGGNAAGGLFVLAGSRDYNAAGATWVGHPGSHAVAGSGRDVVLVEIQRDIAVGQMAHGSLQLTSGDFDGNGRADLAVGTPLSFFSTARTEDPVDKEPDPSAERLYVLWDIADVELDVDRGVTTLVVSLSEAGAMLSGEAAAGQNGLYTHGNFGYLPGTCAIDLDLDRVDDLLVGAPAAHVDTAVATAGAGRVYVVYGAPRSYQLPTSGTTWLANRDVPGSGLYVVAPPTGQPFRAPRICSGPDRLRFLPQRTGTSSLSIRVPGH